MEFNDTIAFFNIGLSEATYEKTNFTGKFRVLNNLR